MAIVSPASDSVLLDDYLTAAILMVDDDLLIAASDVEFAFHTWQVHTYMFTST